MRIHQHLVMACLCAIRWNGFNFVRLSALSVSAMALSLEGTGRSRMSSSTKEGVGLTDIGAACTANADAHDNGNVENMSWRSLLERSSNKSRKIRGSNYVQLATIDPETNEPRCRTVVFRGFLPLATDHPCTVQCDQLPCVAKMITDLHSEKVDQLTKHSNRVAELLWWFPKSSEQYRIRGDVQFVGNGNFDKDDDHELKAARKQMWGNISDSARESFLTGVIPGQDFAEVTSCPPSGGRDEDGKVLPPPDNFLLVLLLPKQVDYLSLSNNYRQVDSIVDGEWSYRRVMP